MAALAAAYAVQAQPQAQALQPPTAQPSPAPGGPLGAGGGPTDVTADKLEVVNAQHLAIWRGNVEAVQNGKRLVCDVLNVYFDSAPTNAPAGASTGAGAAKPGAPEGWGQINHMVADGHVFFVTETQTARGEHAVYEAASDTITMTGNVVVVQGENVVKGDKMVMQVQTGHTDVISNTTGRNKPERVRGVFYNDNQNQNPPPAAVKPPAVPAKPALAPANP
jgi:lipopolysaccharide export system protein LptA